MIDLSIGTGKHDDDSLCEKTLSSIRLNTLKLMTYFNSKVPENVQQKNVKWGYTFCNSVDHHFDRCDLREFNLKNYEEFENKIDSRFESERVKRAQLSESCQTHDKKVEEGHGGLTAEKLANAVKELLHDFQWDRPDVSSPIKPQYRYGNKKHTNVEESKQHNIVLLYSCCPHSRQDVDTFSENAEYEPTFILETFMNNVVYRQFYEQTKIKLFWVDLAADQTDLQQVNTSMFKFNYNIKVCCIRDYPL